MPLKKLLFVDTNIWLDFYRARNETGLGLLKHAEEISQDIIVTYQLEGEFKRNRQAVILEGMKELKSPERFQRLPIFSDAKATNVIATKLKDVDKQVKRLRVRLGRVLANPALHDPVYKACQRIFHRDSSIVLARESKLRHAIRRRAFKRFLHGCAPRKPNDTSIGDAFNWEWMVHCAKENKAELVVVSRDSDYGVSFDQHNYVNDDLRQEFSERVSKKRKLILCSKLSDALKHFKINVSPQEEQAESEIVASATVQQGTPQSGGFNRLADYFRMSVGTDDSRPAFREFVDWLQNSTKLSDLMTVESKKPSDDPEKS